MAEAALYKDQQDGNDNMQTDELQNELDDLEFGGRSEHDGKVCFICHNKAQDHDPSLQQR